MATASIAPAIDRHVAVCVIDVPARREGWAVINDVAGGVVNGVQGANVAAGRDVLGDTAVGGSGGLRAGGHGRLCLGQDLAASASIRASPSSASRIVTRRLPR